MKKSISILITIVMAVTLFGGCKKATNTTTPESSPKEKSELVNGRFEQTRKITVEVYDRANDGGSKPEDNFYTKFIKEGMLRDHNVEVTFKPVPRWTEVQQINNLLAAGDAPDVCVTYDYPTIQTYSNMGGIMDLAPVLEKNKKDLTNLWGLLTDTNIYYDQDPEKKTIWAIEARLANSARISTFVRKDWLKKLNLSEPKTLQEFEAMLKAFKDNAATLLGKDASKMVPFSISADVAWRAEHLLSSFIPSNISDKDTFVYGFDDRKLLYPGFKNGVKKLNEWYNAGLIWKDFSMYNITGDKTEDNMMKAGYVGAFIHNWDYPYRDGDNSINNSIKRAAGQDADYIAVMPFKNDAGKYAKFLPGPVDRKLFLPATNKEPLASLLYLDWISKLENRKFLQIGEEGVTHQKMPDGAVKTIAAKGEKIMNSPSNLDYTITINGMDLGNADLNIKSIALGYVGVDASIIEQAYKYTLFDGRFVKKFNVGEIKSEAGMGPALGDKRNTLLTKSVVASPSSFDSTFDSGMKDYLSSGGQAIIDERKAAYEKFYK
jgi:putative aldouronate transport system substrate-binding protein